ncbi:MAG: HD domain-containing protein [Clostridia bacterium]|nr:HD domain-containing protein [Clostridia bacterium]
MSTLEQDREEFLSIFESAIQREGAKQLLEFLTSKNCDFFTAPASTKYHYAFEGGLLNHSLNVYHCLKEYLARQRVKDVYGLEYSDESIAIAALLHDLCKVNFYKIGSRNVKDANGVWQTVPTYEINDRLPYGHGEKSVYIISGYMKLTREEAFAIRYHMGFSGGDDERNVGKAFEMFPLAVALSFADMEATFFLEKNTAE